MRRRHMPVAVALLVAAVAAGCSGGTPSANSAVSKVETRTKATGTAHAALTIETGPPDSPTPARRTEEGDFDFKAGKARIKAAGATGSETLFIGDDVYSSVPESAAAKISGGKPWLKQSRLAPSAGGPVEQLLQPTDPIKLLGIVQKVSTGGELVGHEKVRGTATDHYRLRADVHRLADLEPDPARRAQLADRIKGVSGTPLAVDLWVDADGRARRIVTKVDIALFTGATGSSPSTTGPAPTPGVVTVTTELFDPGVRLNIQPPPADQVSDGPRPAGP